MPGRGFGRLRKPTTGGIVNLPVIPSSKSRSTRKPASFLMQYVRIVAQLFLTMRKVGEDGNQQRCVREDATLIKEGIL